MLDTLVSQIPITDIPQGTEHHAVLEGLRTGEFVRYGGVIRHSAGTPEGGQIVAHLRDVFAQEGPQETPSPVFPGLSSLNGGAAKALTSTLQMSQVAAAASVLNLGVSIAGFAYMAKRMNDLQNDLALLDQRMEAGFDHIDNKLEAVLVRLEEIRHVVHANHQQGQALLGEVRSIRDALFGQQKGKLLAALEMVDVGASTLENNLQTFKEVRHAMAEELRGGAASWSLQHLMDTGVRFRLWALATAAEALALLRLNKEANAIECYEKAAAFATGCAQQWMERGLPTPDWTIWANRRFEDSVSNERLFRLATALEDDTSRAHLLRRQGEGAIQHDLYVRELSDDEKQEHVGLASLADTAVEVANRLDSNATEIRMCHRHGIPIDDWQRLGQNRTEPLLLLPKQQNEWV